MIARLPRDADLLVRQTVLDRLGAVDALLFDVDGVLLDVADSLRVVVCDTIQRFLEDHCNWSPGGPLIEPDEVSALQAGGFANYWELTQAAVLYLLTKTRQDEPTTATAVREATLDMEDFLERLQSTGGGLNAAERILMPHDSAEKRRELTLQWDRRLIVRLFQEHYAGDDHCRELYGFDPEHVHGPGRVEEERPLIDASLLPDRIHRYGVLTNRTLEETELALERTDLLGRIRPRNIVCEAEGARKPNPDVLRDLASATGAHTAFYVGDEPDDLRLVTEYGKSRRNNEPQIMSCQVLSGVSGKRDRQLYLEQGADIIAPDVNALLRLLGAD